MLHHILTLLVCSGQDDLAHTFAILFVCFPVLSEEYVIHFEVWTGPHPLSDHNNNHISYKTLNCCVLPCMNCGESQHEQLSLTDYGNLRPFYK